MTSFGEHGFRDSGWEFGIWVELIAGGGSGDLKNRGGFIKNSEQNSTT